MNLLGRFNTAIDNINEAHLESIDVNDNTSHVDVMAIIGLAAPLVIMIFELLKKIPGKRREKRNLKYDKIIAAFRIAALVAGQKFKL